MVNMRPIVRVVLWLATAGLPVSFIVAAAAQPAPPGDEQAGEAGKEPPAVAGRLAVIAGSVSFHAAGATEWSVATLNYPLTSGDGVWTQPQAAATIEIEEDDLVLDEATEFDVVTLDQAQLVANEPQGAIFLRLNSLTQGQSVTIDTPRGAVRLEAAGSYEIAAGDTEDATSITVVEGAAHVSAADLSLDIGPQQTGVIGGTDRLQGSVGPMQQDAFLQRELRRPRPQAIAVVPPSVQDMTGAEDLQQYGSWSDEDQYGAIWYPSGVPVGWAPYRQGRWAYVQPWGWTWVDDEPWGFAPFHYGRWLQLHRRWGWLPGGGGPAFAGFPVYAPALVAFLDVGAEPAWFPLGPREPFYPWYHTGRDYFDRLNAPYGVPQDVLRRGPAAFPGNGRIDFVNEGAAIGVPAAAFARGERLGGIARPVPERVLSAARPVMGRLPVRPTAFTPNPGRAGSPGPRIVAGDHAARGMPALRHAAAPGDLRPMPAARVAAQPRGQAVGIGGASVPAVHGPEPRPGLPGLRQPGSRPETLAPAAGARADRRPGAADAEARHPEVREPAHAGERGEVHRPAPLPHIQTPRETIHLGAPRLEARHVGEGAREGVREGVRPGTPHVEPHPAEAPHRAARPPAPPRPMPHPAGRPMPR